MIEFITKILLDKKRALNSSVAVALQIHNTQGTDFSEFQNAIAEEILKIDEAIKWLKENGKFGGC